MRFLPKSGWPTSSKRLVSSYYDAVIVGGGLVGNAMACAIGANPDLKSKKVLLLEGNKAPFLPQSPTPTYSNRVSAISPVSIELFKKLDIWDRVSSYRSKKVENLQVFDACSTSQIHFDRPRQQEIAYIIENDVIIAALFEKLLSDYSSTVEIRASASVKECSLPDSLADVASVTLSTGDLIETSLLIGADGFKSKVRQAANVDYTSWNYDQCGLVATLEVESLNNNDTAWQRFSPVGPIALLPLSPTHSSLVWTTTPVEADRLQKLPQDQFIDELNHALFTEANQNHVINKSLFAVSRLLPFCSQEQFGAGGAPPQVIRLQSDTRAVFPLGFGNAHSYIAERCALIGDAAHRVHPLAGQGVNLGWNDVLILEKVLAAAAREGADLEYDTLAQRHNVPVMVAIDLLNRLYRTTAPSLVLLRSFGLSAVNGMKPLKDYLVHHLSTTSSR